MDIKKVAEYAGVSIATVSRAINHSGPVSEKSRKRVLDAINALEYKPNIRARELRMNKSNAIITILNDIRNPIFAEAIKGMEDVAYENGFHLLIGNTSNSKDRELNYIEALRMRKADGAIMITPRINRAVLMELHHKIPIVLINDHVVDDRIPSVGINDYLASYDMTQLLIHKGHKKIGCISGSALVPIATQRRKGYEKALKKNGIPVKSQWIIDGEHTFEGGYTAMESFIALDNLPTALVCYNDEMAMGALRCCKNHGMHIPGDISIAGFDNISTTTVIEPALTTVYQPTYDIGRHAVHMLLSLIDGEELKERRLILDYKIIERDSVKTLTPS